MKVELAESAGFCFGVKRAVDTVYRLAQEKPEAVYTLGPIIHNEQVVSDLNERGVRVADKVADIKNSGEATLVIRSHGVSKAVVEELDRQGISYEDATCPFVKKIHETVSHYSGKGYHIIIIGSPSHPEVQGILGWTS
ncbi:MAG: 4-hydroxy-3-methylbut-2-enyl diphosphate reductase, partial [Lachnospiraceae bacterium]|nr:4-hydroxy-3-methylbut-2-enyl diphosphate reductase [Lachnospiraceae bacterium]